MSLKDNKKDAKKHHKDKIIKTIIPTNTTRIIFSINILIFLSLVHIFEVRLGLVRKSLIYFQRYHVRY